MNIRVLIAIIVVAFVAVEIQARGPFGRSRNMRQSIPRQTQPSQPTTQNFSRNPEEMTKRFGPSILIRKESVATDSPKFVNQPK